MNIYLVAVFVALMTVMFINNKEILQELWRKWWIEPRIPLPKPRVIPDIHTFQSIWNMDTMQRRFGSPEGIAKTYFMGKPLWTWLGISKEAVIADLMWKEDTCLRSIHFKFRLAGDPKWHDREISRETFLHA